MRVLYRFLILSGFTSRAKLGLAGYPNRRALCKHLTDARFHILRQLSGPHQCVIWNNTSTGHCFTSGIIPENLKKKRKRQQCSFSHASWFLRKPKRLEKPTSWLWLLLASPCVFMIVLFILVPSSFCCETSLSSSQHLPICANQRPPFYVVSWLSMRSIAGISSRGPIRQSPQRAWNSSRSPVANLGTFPTFQVAMGQGWSRHSAPTLLFKSSNPKKNGGFCTWNC